MTKEWKVFESDDCPNCGNSLHVLTECLEKDDPENDTLFCDGDEVQCMGDCGFTSFVSVNYDDAAAYISDGNIMGLEVIE